MVTRLWPDPRGFGVCFFVTIFFFCLLGNRIFILCILYILAKNKSYEYMHLCPKHFLLHVTQFSTIYIVKRFIDQMCLLKSCRSTRKFCNRTVSNDWLATMRYLTRCVDVLSLTYIRISLSSKLNASLSWFFHFPLIKESETKEHHVHVRLPLLVAG